MTSQPAPAAGSAAGPDGRARPRDSLGCAAAALDCDQEIAGADFVVYRKAHHGGISRVETPPSGRGLLVGIALAPGHRRRIFRGERPGLYAFEPGACYVRSFAEDYRADIETGFDFLLLELSREGLDRTLMELELPAAEGLSCPPGTRDPVLAELGRALLPALAAPQAPPLLVEQTVCRVQAHLAGRLHGAPPRRGKGPRRLAGWQVERAQQMLLARIDGSVLIAEVAAACGTSRSQFIRGFRESTGATPYRWLMTQRIERARGLLMHSRLPLAEVALSCGFADQSHMTRLFSRMTGATPGSWRARL